MQIRTQLLATAALVALTGAAYADMGVPRRTPPSLPPAPVYVGLNGGYGWAKGDATLSPFGTTAIADIVPQSVSGTANGAVFGAQVGYNWQAAPNWVWGIEGDFDGSGMSNTQSVVFGSRIHPRLLQMVSRPLKESTG